MTTELKTPVFYFKDDELHFIDENGDDCYLRVWHNCINIHCERRLAPCLTPEMARWLGCVLIHFWETANLVSHPPDEAAQLRERVVELEAERDALSSFRCSAEDVMSNLDNGDSVYCLLETAIESCDAALRNGGSKEGSDGN